MADINARDIPIDLQKFIDFANENDGFWEEFSIIKSDDDFLDVWIDTWDWTGADLALAKRDLIPLGEADGSGGYFAFWDDGSEKSLYQMPIVILGSEGDLALVAQNLKGLMRLMTIGGEFFLHENSVSCDEDYIGDYNNNYADWLKDEFNIDPIENEEEAIVIFDNANNMFAQAFTQWAKQAINPDYEIG